MSQPRNLIVTVALFVVAACGTEQTNTIPENGGAIRFNLHEISAESRACVESDAKCARVKLKTIKTTGGETEAARDNIDLYLLHDLVSRMRSLFPEEGFTLPDNLGITADGIIFHWDAYQIAPYSMGPIDVTVPAEELTAIIDQKYW